MTVYVDDMLMRADVPNDARYARLFPEAAAEFKRRSEELAQKWAAMPGDVSRPGGFPVTTDTGDGAESIREAALRESAAYYDTEAPRKGAQ